MKLSRWMAVGMLVLMMGAVWAGDWPQWRGPNLNGSAGESDLPIRFGPAENVIWKQPLPGESSATPVICNGRVFVSSTDKDSDALLALCFDEETGRQLWRKTLGRAEGRLPRNNMATPSPAADAERVYFLYASGDMVALDHSGNILWRRYLVEDFGNFSIKFGFSTSPLLHEDKVIVSVLRRDRPYRDRRNDKPLDSYLLAVDAKTGDNLWRTERKTDAIDETMDSYTTPIIYNNDGREELVVFAADWLTAHDPDTGKLIWRFCYAHEKESNWRNIPSPVAAGDLLVGVLPRGGRVLAYEPKGQGLLDDSGIKWTFDGPAPDCSTPLFYKDSLYILDGMRHGKVITCLEPRTGNVRWEGRIGGKGPWRASLTGADDKIYCMNESGETVVLAADKEQFRILFRGDMDEPRCISTIAVANKRLFVRTSGHLYCFGTPGD